MSQVWVVAFAPSSRANGGIGGFDWFSKESAAQSHYDSLLLDPDYAEDDLYLAPFDIFDPSDSITETVDNDLAAVYANAIQKRVASAISLA